MRAFGRSVAALASVLLGLALASSLAAAQSVSPPPAVDRLGQPGPFVLRGVEYRLAWSARPTPTYLKQEYVPAGQTPERFERMVLIEYAAEADPAAVAAAKVKELAARKPNDPTTNWSIMKNSGPKAEIVVDFVLSAPTADGGGVSEWNAYRYASGPGGRGVVLFAMSRRAYGDARLAFFQNLKTERRADLAALVAYPMVLVSPQAN